MDEPGKYFGNYEIIGEISRGSFGVVYKVRQPGLDRLAALKVLLAGAYASTEAVARFQREAKAVARLKHPAIVPVYDTGIFEGRHYFAMEFVAGQALSELIKDKSLTTSRALEITEMLADAIESAHKAGVIHRDIKPSNILIDKEGQPHLTDFGLAKQVDLDTKYTVSGTTLGTPAYMPPEQARGEIERIDARSDVYSLGAVLYEMLAGQTPFSGRSLLDVVMAVINEPVKPPRQLNPRLNHDIQTIVMKSLEKDPRLRYQTAAAMRDDIRRFRAGETILAKPAGVMRLAGRFVKRHAPFFIAAAVVLLVVSYSAVELNQKTKKIVEQTQTIVKQDEEKRKIEAEALNRKKLEWLPVWWFPPKSEAELAGAEKAKLYKVPPGKEDLKLKDVSLAALDDLPAAPGLASPEEFFGDLDLDFTFNLDEGGAEQMLRLGLQSADKAYRGIPFFAEIKAGTMTLRGPADLYAYTDPPPEKTRPALKLAVKAEKEIPSLPPGLYTLHARRRGIELAMGLECARPRWNCTLEISDVNLSSWVFKRTQFFVRAPGAGLQPAAAEVRARFGGEEDEAFKDFHNGEYDDAQKRLLVLAEGKDYFLRACAKDKLGLLDEIFHPGQTSKTPWYGEALAALDKVQDLKLEPAALESLRKELRTRKLLSVAHDRQKQPGERWAGFREELAAWKADEKIGEPLAWDFQSALEQLLHEKPTELEIFAKLDVGLAIFQHLGLPPGSQRLGKSAGELAALLAANSRYSGLVALHKAYPAAALCDAFFDALAQMVRDNNFAEALGLFKYITPYIRTGAQAAKLQAAACAVAVATLKLHKYDIAAGLVALLRSPKLFEVVCVQVEEELKVGGEDFEKFSAALLPSMLAALPSEAEPCARFTGLMEKLARALAASAKPDELRKLHVALRGAEATDPRLAGAFAAAITDLAAVGEPAAEAQALELLKYCGEHVTVNDPSLKLAALLLAKNKAGVNGRRDYTFILAIQRAYPVPELLELALGVMRQLVERRRYEEAAAFFNQARLVFWTGGGELSAWYVAALNGLATDEARNRFFNLAKTTVQAGLDELKDDSAVFAWNLECGDIELALDNWERARQTYQQLLASPKAEPAVQAKAWLRLVGLACLHPGAFRAGALQLPPALEAAVLPDDMKLALRLLGSSSHISLEELAHQRRAATPPLELSDGEWSLLSGLRLLMDQNFFEAQPLLQKAELQSGPAALWVHALASELQAGGQ